MDAIKFPLSQKVWKCRACDNIQDPKIATAFLVTARTMIEAAANTRETKAFKDFKESFPNAELISAEFVGEMS